MTFCLLSLYLTETKCKIRFIYVGFNCKRKKSGVKKCLEICAIKGGGAGPLMANAILNFHFDFPHPSLMDYHLHLKKSVILTFSKLVLLVGGLQTMPG